MNKHKIANKPSSEIQQQYNEVCFRLGQEIGNERRAIENQEQLKDLQKEVEAAYAIAKSREDDTAMRKQRDEMRKKNEADKKEAEEAQKQVASALAPTA